MGSSTLVPDTQMSTLQTGGNCGNGCQATRDMHEQMKRETVSGDTGSQPEIIKKSLNTMIGEKRLTRYPEVAMRISKRNQTPNTSIQADQVHLGIECL